MAVAAHVSRVSKEYAPHGYSVMQDVNLTVGRIAGAESSSGAVAHTIATADETFAILPLDDADVFVEGAWIYYTAEVGTHNGTNAFELSISYADNDGSLSNAVSLASTGVKRTDSTAPKTLTTLSVDQNQSVPSGKVLYLTVGEHGDVAALALDGVSCIVRYRRKA